MRDIEGDEHVNAITAVKTGNEWREFRESNDRGSKIEMEMRIRKHMQQNS
jgi:hypothetical protein